MTKSILTIYNNTIQQARKYTVLQQLGIIRIYSFKKWAEFSICSILYQPEKQL